MANTKSILQRLRNKAKEENISFQLVLQLFCQEEFLRRLSHSEYRENLILKGGLFLYLITSFDSRPTMDIDFLMKNPFNDQDKIREMIDKIIDTDTGNSFIRLQTNSFELISEHRDQPGVRVKMIGHIENTRTPFDIDANRGQSPICIFFIYSVLTSYNNADIILLKEVILMAQINIRIDDKLKEQAELLFAELGLNMTTAFNIFLRQSVRQGGIPFEITTQVDPFYNELNIQMLMESIKEFGEGKTVSKSLEDLKEMEQ